jgi:hypothetical protein
MIAIPQSVRRPQSADLVGVSDVVGQRSADVWTVPPVESRALAGAERQGGAGKSVLSDAELTATPQDQSGLEIRRELGWGRYFVPPIRDSESRRLFQQICSDLHSEIKEVDEFVVHGELAAEGAGVVAEVLNHLERLYDCQFGEGESLKMAVVAIQSQVNNAHWTAKHVDFLKAAISFLSARWVVTEQTADTIDDMIEEHALDVFRGTISDSDVLVGYRVERDR